MTCWVAIPVKAPEACKTRLRSRLGEAARTQLVASMLQHVWAVAGATPGVDRVVLVGPSRHGLPSSTPLVADPGGGLNAALIAARAEGERAGVDRLVVVAGDLPKVTVGDLTALVDLPTGVAAIAPDRWGRGTNGLSLPLPAAASFTFCYGPESFQRHCEAAAHLDLAMRVVRTSTWGLDIDEFEDIAALAPS